ncbi:putative F-box protein At2g02030 [Triticum dicoccoides]|uniref:putative F-box protein At2g02030 n=1 Tax=Triticum dicoccoides TaxID=85692 RepID=UPI00188F2B09|nr:putative F-box protein At2g02030 [Triticum dicoccoides]
MSCLPQELILVRLPAKSLLRLRCVCKAWRDTISGADPSFSQEHLYRLHQQVRKPCSLLIAPRIRSERIKGKIATPGLYLWEESRQGVATLLHDTSSFTDEEAKTRHGFGHCDGLVLLPAEDTVCVLNPATSRIIELPWSPNNVAPRRHLVAQGHQAFGFGRDHRSNAYKVARFFYHETRAMGSHGMEVFTIGKDQYWRETAAQPPYPFLAGWIATFLKGSLIWTVDQYSLMYECNPSLLPHHASMTCFVRFSLEDESFSIMTGPPWFEAGDYLESRLAKLNGELAIHHLGPNYESVEIWMCNDAESNNPPRWEQHHVFNFQAYVRLIATFNDEIVYQDGSSYLWRQTHQGNKFMVCMTDLKYRNPDMGTLVEYSWGTIKDFDAITTTAVLGARWLGASLTVALRRGLLEFQVGPDNGFTFEHVQWTKVGGFIFKADRHGPAVHDVVFHDLDTQRYLNNARHGNDKIILLLGTMGSPQLLMLDK